MNESLYTDEMIDRCAKMVRCWDEQGEPDLPWGSLRESTKELFRVYVYQALRGEASRDIDTIVTLTARSMGWPRK